MVIPSKYEKGIVATILVIGMLSRLLGLGWTFLLNFWLFIPCYATVFFGQTLVLMSNYIDKFRRLLLYASSILLLFFTFYQVECADNKCLHLIDCLLSYLGLQLFSNAKGDLSLTSTMLSLYIVFGAMGSILVLLGMLQLFSPKPLPQR